MGRRDAGDPMSAPNRKRPLAAACSRGIDICFNATSNDDVQGTALAGMPFDDFMRPVTKSVAAHFNVATAAARHMAASGGA